MRWVSGVCVSVWVSRCGGLNRRGLGFIDGGEGADEVPDTRGGALRVTGSGTYNSKVSLKVRIMALSTSCILVFIFCLSIGPSRSSTAVRVRRGVSCSVVVSREKEATARNG